ncbi:hypothetical protein [Salegentibacter chungangensis]|uniref:ABM domain-containing protein n=1 Tax=Salegentibacter chungangensis TaxID=1335724 RepID=A0ABW3NVX8_9FLAO
MGLLKKGMQGSLALLFLFCGVLTAQEKAQEDSQEESQQEEFKPVYLTVSTFHWNDDPDIDFSEWLDTEKEYFEKVTSKNDLIIGSGFYMHYFTPDNSEIIQVSVYENWADIEKANEKNQELIEAAWPDEEKRRSFFQKQNSYYSPQHSDEIYTSMRFHKPMEMASEEPLVYYVKSSELSMNGEGSPASFGEYNKNVVQKNKFVKAYYTHRHLWGANSREMAEVFVFEDLADLEASFEEDERLVGEHWPDEGERESFMEDMGKLFTGRHSDYIYRNVPELMK